MGSFLDGTPRDPNRIDSTLQLVKEAWEKNPDLRLGQLISNAAHIGGYTGTDSFFAEDNELADGLRKLK